MKVNTFGRRAPTMPRLAERRSPFRSRAFAGLGLLGIVGAGLLLAKGPSHVLDSMHASAAVIAAAGMQAPSASAIVLADTPEPSAPPPETLHGSPESRLIATYRLVAAGNMAQALGATDQLVREVPTFKLAQLLRADLLSARAGQVDGYQVANSAPRSPAVASDVAVMLDEARLRIQALQERPPQDALPDEFVSLPASTPYAIAVDTSRARLYLFRNDGQGLKLVEDFYVSVGKQGVDKSVEGDQRTPLGVYFTTDRLDAHTLQERFGAGALPLNYPNAYDKAKGRTGSGILLHGVPANTYSRPPLDSDGCVAMANPDLVRLARLLPQRDTPVIITRKISWTRGTAPAAKAESTDFERAFARWQASRLSADLDGLQALYLPRPASAPLAPADAKAMQRLAHPAAGITDVSVLTWHDDKDMMVVTFRELASTVVKARSQLMRQYWARQDGNWRIVAEGSVHS